MKNPTTWYLHRLEEHNGEFFPVLVESFTSLDVAVVAQKKMGGCSQLSNIPSTNSHRIFDLGIPAEVSHA